LVKGQDDALKAAYADLGKAMEQERRTVELAGLVGIEQAKAGIAETHADVQEGLQIAGRIEDNTTTLMTEVQKLRLDSERMEKLLQGRSLPISFWKSTNMDLHQREEG
jgi:hypothetical protein